MTSQARARPPIWETARSSLSAYFYLYEPYPWPPCVGTPTAANGDRLELDMEGTAVPGVGRGNQVTVRNRPLCRCDR